MVPSAVFLRRLIVKLAENKKKTQKYSNYEQPREQNRKPRNSGYKDYNRKGKYGRIWTLYEYDG